MIRKRGDDGATLSTFTNIPVGGLSIRHVKNSIVTRSQLVLTKSGVSPYCLFENLPSRYRRRMNLVAIGSALKNRLHFLENRPDYFFLMNVWSLGYHHWLAEVSIKFLLFERELRKGKILLPASRPKYISEFLSLLDFNNIIDTEDNVFARRLNVITNPNSGHFDPSHMNVLRTWASSKTGLTQIKPSRRIYVTRATAKVRKVVNDDEVIEYLAKRGFECIDLEDASFLDQIKLFAEAETFVSLHGSALTNAVFMKPGGRVIELYPRFRNREIELNACFYRLSKLLDLRHDFLFSQRENEDDEVKFRSDNIFVNVGALGEMLDQSNK